MSGSSYTLPAAEVAEPSSTSAKELWWTRSRPISTWARRTGESKAWPPPTRRADAPPSNSCIQVYQAASAEDPTAWAEFSNKVKEGIITTFDSNVLLYEEDVRKADSQRQLDGWQYLPFFLQKVSESALDWVLHR